MVIFHSYVSHYQRVAGALNPSHFALNSSYKEHEPPRYESNGNNIISEAMKAPDDTTAIQDTSLNTYTVHCIHRYIVYIYIYICANISIYMYVY